MIDLVQQEALIGRIVHAARRRWVHEYHLGVWFMDDIGVAYISTPKAASSSIRNLIRLRQSKILYPDSNELMPRIDKHVKTALSPSHARKLKEKYYVFSYVRNPLARLYSCYRDKVIDAATQQKKCGLSRHGIEFGVDFDDFVARIAEIPDDQANQHFRSLHTFLTYEGTSLVHWLGRFERFESDWQHLTTRFGLPCPERNRRVTGPIVSLSSLPYTRKSAQLAIKRYQQDIEQFGYKSEIDVFLESLPHT